ncbi:transient-receptor-potential-like protein isoform X2 [Ptychodera flava]|uniref:transient-receptor-potential-like protein isoform X2 n=1 Tax=Ptychodera flava TaxID=63121 RepID=UPI00396A6144
MGFLLYSAFCLLCVIVLVNLFIAIMSDTYARLQEAVDIEWKFKRATMWMHYFGAPTLAPPLNLLSFIPWFIEWCISNNKACHCYTHDSIQRVKCHSQTDGKLNSLNYDHLMKILVNRFLKDVDATLTKYTDVIEPENGVTKSRSCEYDNVVFVIEESGV